jgi:glycosyltransferase involved in cell wall biosynthesis
MKKEIIFLTSHPMSVVSFLLPHIKALDNIFNVRVIANTCKSTLLQQHGLDIRIERVSVVRHISLWKDLRAFWSLFEQFRDSSPFAVHTITPKAGLLGIGAAWLARTPMRVHIFTGQVWVTRSGPMRWLLKFTDKCIATLATDILVDSPSQRTFLIDQGVISAERSRVLGAGSVCGVNTQRFCPSPAVRESLRNELSTRTNAFVCLYLGRLNRDKGVLDLANAFLLFAKIKPNSELWIVGPDEANWFEQMQVILKEVSSQVKRVDYTSQPEKFMQAADIFCLPSYREGFGSSVIEAAACGLPTLASRIYGLTDAVMEEKTGWMYESGNINELTAKLIDINSDPVDLVDKGIKARRYAKEFFDEVTITNVMIDFYKARFNEATN